MKFIIKCESIKKLDCQCEVTYSSKTFSLDAKFKYPEKSTKDYSSLIDENLQVLKPDFSLIYDWLTITFDGKDYKLKSFDDYTNIVYWERCHLEFPVISSAGICKIYLATKNVDRISVKYKPKYFFDDTQKILKIRLSEAKNQKFYQISSNIIIGVSNEYLSSIIIKSLLIENN